MPNRFSLKVIISIYFPFFSGFFGLTNGFLRSGTLCRVADYKHNKRGITIISLETEEGSVPDNEPHSGRDEPIVQHRNVMCVRSSSQLLILSS